MNVLSSVPCCTSITAPVDEVRPQGIVNRGGGADIRRVQSL